MVDQGATDHAPTVRESEEVSQRTSSSEHQVLIELRAARDALDVLLFDAVSILECLRKHCRRLGR